MTVQQTEENELPSPGEFIDQSYQVVRPIGVGASATIFLVRHALTDDLYALKILKKVLFSDERAKKRFEREATTLSKTIHPNLVKLHAHGQAHSGAPYFVMDFLEGRSLASVLSDGSRLDTLRVCRIAIQICDGMTAAHEVGVLHRDLKPNNILLVGEGTEKELVKIVDFGIAKELSAELEQKLTQDGLTVGTPGFMGPEQCCGLELDQRSDVYSLGCIMYKALSGVGPFQADNAIALLYKHVTESHVPPMEVYEPKMGAYPKLEKIVSKTLARRAEDRYQSMKDLKKDISEFVAATA
jgi:eukaryotic-like serine/threonine-protein kinase